MEALFKAIAAGVPFLQLYPFWVKAAVSVCVLSLAVSLVGLIVAAPPVDAKPGSASTKAKGAELTIEGVTLFGRVDDVKVTANVNGLSYVYPTKDGIEWLQAGQSMAPQTFAIPVEESYKISFSMEGRRTGSYGSVETQTVQKQTDEAKSFRLRQIENRTRASPISAEVSYRISVR